MTYAEAADELRTYLETYSIPKEAEEAVNVAILALRRCEIMDEQYERKKKEKKK